MIEQFESKNQIVETLQRLQKSEFHELNMNLEDTKTDADNLALEERILKLQRVMADRIAHKCDEQARINQLNLHIDKLAKIQARNSQKLNYLKSIGVRRVDGKFKHQNFTVRCIPESEEVIIEYLNEHKALQYFHESGLISRLLYHDMN